VSWSFLCAAGKSTESFASHSAAEWLHLIGQNAYALSRLYPSIEGFDLGSKGAISQVPGRVDATLTEVLPPGPLFCR